MDDEPRRRSRFDKEPDLAKKSRFDRRSRSPPREDSDPHTRSRSPLKSPTGEVGNDAKVNAAAAAAARINASINAKKAITTVDVPPIRQESTSAGTPPARPTSSGNDEIYQQDGDYIKDIEINDLHNRYLLTKGSTQKMIKEKTGADVTTRGSYVPNKSMATAANPPLYLHVTSTTKDGLEKAVQELNGMMQQELPKLVDERRFRRPDRQEERPQFERDHLGRRKWPEERIPIDLEPIPGFNLRAQVVGQGGQFVKHIQQETGCKVQIKGRGSGYIEKDTDRESDEQMYLHITSPQAEAVEEGRKQALSLLEVVKGNYEEFKNRPPRGGGERGGYGEQRGGYQPRDRNGSGQYNQPEAQDDGNGQYGYGYNASQGPQSAGGYAGTAQSPTSAQAPQAATDPAVLQAWIEYYRANPAADPYAQYGGYEYAMQYYTYAQQQGGAMPGQPGSAPAQSPQQGQNGWQAPPPPPPPGT